MDPSEKKWITWKILLRSEALGFHDSRVINKHTKSLFETSPIIFPSKSKVLFSCSVTSDSLRPHGLWPASLLCLWGFPEKNPGVGHYFLQQGTFPTQGSNLHLLHWQVDSLPLSHLGSPRVNYWWNKKRLQVLARESEISQASAFHVNIRRQPFPSPRAEVTRLRGLSS